MSFIAISGSHWTGLGEFSHGSKWRDSMSLQTLNCLGMVKVNHCLKEGRQICLPLHVSQSLTSVSVRCAVTVLTQCSLTVTGSRSMRSSRMISVISALFSQTWYWLVSLWTACEDGHKGPSVEPSD
eukprot:3732343-Amphidinium_carterae.1